MPGKDMAPKTDEAQNTSSRTEMDVDTCRPPAYQLVKKRIAFSSLIASTRIFHSQSIADRLQGVGPIPVTLESRHSFEHNLHVDASPLMCCRQSFQRRPVPYSTVSCNASASVITRFITNSTNMSSCCKDTLGKRYRKTSFGNAKASTAIRTTRANTRHIPGRPRVRANEKTLKLSESSSALCNCCSRFQES